MDEVAGDGRPKVAFVISGLSPISGLESATIAVAEALAETCDIRFVLLADDVPKGLERYPFEFQSWGGKATDWKRVLTVLRALRHRHEFDDEVIVVSGAWAAIPVVAALPRSSRRRTIVWEHSFGTHQVNVDRRRAILRRAARIVYSKAHITVAVSELLRRELRAAGFRGAIESIPNIVQRLEPLAAQQAEPGRLVTIGSLRPVKNQELALRTIAVLPERYSLDVLGDGPNREALEKLAVDLGIAGRVKFWGHVPEPEVHVARAEMVIHPALGETYGLALFEAAQLGKPVVAVNQSVMADVIPDLVPGVVTNPDPEAFAASVLALEAAPIGSADFANATVRRDALSENIVKDWTRLINTIYFTR